MTRVPLLALPLAVALGACAADPRLINREPPMTPVGAGVTTPTLQPPLAAFPASAPSSPDSLWSSTSRSLYGDQRALQVGDTLTVLISLDDSAKLDNRSNRMRDSNIGLDAGIAVPSTGFSWDLGASVGSDSGSVGRGAIERSEALELTVAAVVTNVLPNGNLLISGSQEVRVNFEMRVLSIAGIVRPFDISKNNTVEYEKIAEARLAYGGRGRLTEVQQPAYGQQLYDLIVPF